MDEEEIKANFNEEFSDEYLMMLENKAYLKDELREIMWMCYAHGAKMREDTVNEQTHGRELEPSGTVEIN